jgi:uncharacterized delta-60 repeat protein
MCLEVLERRFALTVGVNDSPSGTDATLALNEDSSYQLTAESFGFTDPIDAGEGAPNALAAVFLTTLPTAGSLRLAGSPVLIGQRIPASSLNTGSGLTFTPAENASGSPYASFQFRVQDNGGTVFGGVDTDPTPNKITFNVLPINDAPVILPMVGPTYISPTDTTAITTGRLLASDVDSGDTLTFGLLSPSVDNGVIVSRVGTFGVLYVRKSTGDFEFHPNSEAIASVLRNTTETYEVNVSDGSLLATTSFTVTAIAKNAPPELMRRIGNVTTQVSTRLDCIATIAQQADEKILVAGSSSASDLSVVRYNLNGTLDTTFGSNGVFFDSSFDSVGGMAVQNDGKIVVVGSKSVFGSVYSNLVVLRLLADGTVDTSFGTSGFYRLVTTAFDSSEGRSVALQSDGKIVVAGFADTWTSTNTTVNDDVLVLRLNSNGTIDNSFDSDGRKTWSSVTQGGTEGSVDRAFALAVQPSGRIIIGGVTDTDVSNIAASNRAFLLGLSSGGGIDSSFGSAGVVRFTGTGSTELQNAVNNIVLAGDGSVVASLYGGVRRFTADGGAPTGFSSLLGSTGSINNVSVDHLGRFVVGGDYSLCRLTQAGVLDATFGVNGSVASQVSYWSVIPWGQRVLVQTDGRLLVGGRSSTSGDEGLRLQRFYANGVEDNTFGDGRGGVEVTASYTEDSNAVVIAPMAGVTDPNLSPLNSGLGDFSGASLSLSRQLVPNEADVFGLMIGPAASNPSQAMFTVSASNELLVGGLRFGRLTQSGGTLTVSFQGDGSGGTAIPSTALVNDVLQRVTYRTTSVVPPPSIEVSWVFSDGNSGSQGGGGPMQAAGTSTVLITATNSAPLDLRFANVTATVRDDASTTYATKVADILIDDDGMGTNSLSLVAGFDAASFEIVGGALFLKAGVQLRYEAKASYVVRVQVTDPAVPFSTRTKDYTLTVSARPISVPIGQTSTDPAIRSGVFQLIKQGGGVLVLNQSNTHTGGVIVEAGEVVVRNIASLGGGTLEVKAGAKVTFDVQGGTASIAGLVLEPGGCIDVGYGRVSVDAGGYALPVMLSMLQSGFAANWKGAAGLVSRTAGTVAGGRLGYVVNNDDSLAFGFAAAGDTNLDDAVDILDVSAMLATSKFNTGVTASWSEGDFNYDGVIDVLDISDLLGASLFNAGPYIPAQSSQSQLQATASSLSAVNVAFLAFAVETDRSSLTPAKKRPLGGK